MIHKALDCPTGLSEANLETLQNGIESEELESIYFATHAIVNFGALDKFDASDLVGIVSKVTALQEGDGTFTGGPSSEETTPLYFTGLAAQTLGLALNHFDVGAEETDVINGSIDELENVLELAEEQDGQMVFVDSDGHAPIIQVTVTLLDAILKLKSSILTKEHIAGFSSFVLDQKHGSSLPNAYYFTLGLEAISTNPIGLPLVFSVSNDRILSSAKGRAGHVVVQVTDMFGQYACDASVYLVKCTQIGGASSVPGQQLLPLNKGQNTEYYLNLIATKPEAGTYSLVFSVTPTGEAAGRFIPLTGVQHSVKVVSSIAVSDLRVSVVDKDQVVSSHHFSVKSGEKLAEEIDADYLQQLSLSFTVKSASGKVVPVQQAFLRISDGKREAYAPAKFDGSVFKVSKTIEDVAAALGHRSGKYSFYLVVGDSFVDNPLVWHFADGHIKMQEMAAEHDAWQALPEIVHTFRAADYRPHDLVALAFVGICAAPLLLMLVGFALTKVNVSALPSGLGGIHALCFQGCIGLLLGLIVLFWVQLRFFDAVKLAAVLAVPTVVFGKGALEARAASRQ